LPLCCFDVAEDISVLIPASIVVISRPLGRPTVSALVIVIVHFVAGSIPTVPPAVTRATTRIGQVDGCHS